MINIPQDAKIDVHTHMREYPIKIDKEKLIKQINAGGFYGAAIFSIDPMTFTPDKRPSVLERCDDLLSWVKGYEDKLFPVLYVDPSEEDVISQTKQALKKNIVALKMSCSDYYVYETKSMDILSLAAEAGKPVMFHSGILWDGKVSAKYNRPMNWEALHEIPKLKFSLAHCSWPWTDECIALYGKFLNSYTLNPNVSSEMFFDLTPGTPVIYRQNLLEKIFLTGYDVPHNILYGTDCGDINYDSESAQFWINYDNEAMNKIGVPDEIKKMLFRDNFLRFIGFDKKEIIHKLPSPDKILQRWSLEDFKKENM